MKQVRLCLATLILALIFASQACAQGSLSWDCGYPTSGSLSGYIKVSGTTSLDCGWKLAGTSAVLKVWPDGQPENSMTFLTCGGSSWSAMYGMLTPGAQYNVVVEIQVVDICTGLQQRTLVTPLATGVVAACFSGQSTGSTLSSTLRGSSKSGSSETR